MLSIFFVLRFEMMFVMYARRTNQIKEDTKELLIGSSWIALKQLFFAKKFFGVFLVIYSENVRLMEI